jgi:hypothetical protein
MVPSDSALLGTAGADGALEAFVSVITGPPGDRPEVLMDRVRGPMLILWGMRPPPHSCHLCPVSFPPTWCPSASLCQPCTAMHVSRSNDDRMLLVMRGEGL